MPQLSDRSSNIVCPVGGTHIYLYIFAVNEYILCALYFIHYYHLQLEMAILLSSAILFNLVFTNIMHITLGIALSWKFRIQKQLLNEVINNYNFSTILPRFIESFVSLNKQRQRFSDHSDGVYLGERQASGAIHDEIVRKERNRERNLEVNGIHIVGHQYLNALNKMTNTE